MTSGMGDKSICICVLSVSFYDKYLNTHLDSKQTGEILSEKYHLVKNIVRDSLSYNIQMENAIWKSKNQINSD